MSKEVEFPAGLFAKRNDKAPDFVLCSLSIRKKEFIAYLESMGGDDWANFQIKRSKNGKVYAQVDTWTPDPDRVHKEGMQQAKASFPAEDGDFGDPPF